MYRRRKPVTFSTTTILVLCGVSIAGFIIVSLFQSDLFSSIDPFVIFFLSVLLCVVLVLIIKAVVAYFQKLRFKNMTFSKIDQMTGYEFEDFVAYLYKQQGYVVQKTGMSGDLGVDLVVQKENVKAAIQVKRYRGSVGRSAISDAVAGMAQYKCTSCAVVTNSYFTFHARKLAYANNCQLIDRKALEKLFIHIESLQ